MVVELLHFKLFWDKMIPYRTESFHFSRLVNSATKLGASIEAPILGGWGGGWGGGSYYSHGLTYRQDPGLIIKASMLLVILWRGGGALSTPLPLIC